MDSNNNAHDQHSPIGQAVINLVRGLLSHTSAASAGAGQASSEVPQATQTPSSAPSLSSPSSETISSGAPSGSPTVSPAIVSSPLEFATYPPTFPESTSTTSMASSSASGATTSQPDSVRDVEMTSVEEASSSSTSSSSQPAPNSQARTTRRARVEDEDEDEDYWRESNRQRMHSPTPHDYDEHHQYMPIPEDHGVPEAPEAAPNEASHAQPNARASTEQPQQQPRGLPPPYGGLFLTLDIIPIPFNDTPGNTQSQDAPQPQATSLPRGAPQPQNAAQPGPQMLNFIMNFPITGHGPAPQAGAAGNGNAPFRPIFLIPPPYVYPPFTDGGNVPGNTGFTFPPFPFPFPFPFGMDRLEERDDPERAQRLVDGLEEVPVGLVKRMQQVGGPGTARGEIPTCAVCWESLLEPEGGGFEGNAELAKAEAAQAARDDSASQQGGEVNMDVDDSAPASSSPGETSSSETTSASSTVPDSSGENPHPKIVVLPCSHAFHATCLLPWFSKPGRTTCPSCRFDIDPDSLTYRPRPLRAHPPQPAPRTGAAPTPQAQAQPVFGPQVPPVAVPQAAPVPAGTAPHGAAGPEGAPPANAEVRPANAPGQAGQQPHQPLPPFVTFDIGMIIPMNPGRAPGAPTLGTQGGNPMGPTVHGPAPPPPPPRTDSNGFRFEDTFLQNVVRETFERFFGRPIPPAGPQAPPTAAGDAAPGENGQDAPRPEWFMYPVPPVVFPPMPPMNTHGPQGAQRSGSRRPAQKRQWTPPPAPGPTLRQVVERNERDVGLRCSDISCGLGPSDDDPVSSIDLSSLRQITIRPPKSDTSGSVCEHKFHPACLVSAERVTGWGHEVKTGEPAGDEGEVEVSCPVCKAMGVISRLEWEEGACALA
ncbi:hypothetical protein L226DRAFT_482339 [Lentinus tigrinus ALCF2SS1-7]|uniref:RING-type domain-containing protein n=1 Tax=Lentinus tigrinus ALCF2SS1-6 TaxID=1328759 RepID=A0A5C2SH49_9APHY|nr:hypothetical protein L227DRAFT_651538 [Lentinus tigrinus ALCF2SS1-6]RPD77647.1 hypothetical protein L226DRAFT_482339 [Lentinus tigrinus ALCF2SS1-7]